MCDPVGLHRRLSTSTGSVVNCFASPPSTEMVQICREPERLLTNAMVRLSGDHVGDESECPGELVSWRCLLPSSDESHKLVVVLLASGSHWLTVKTIHCPSGDGCGSPTRCIRTMS